MKNLKKWFTLIELLVWFSILLIVLTIISWTFIKIHKSIYYANNSVLLTNDLNEFNLINKILTNYESSKIITTWSFDWVIITKNWKNILIWSFLNNLDNYKLSSNNEIFLPNKFWYFYISDKQKNSTDFNNLLLNNWKIFDNLFVDDLKITKEWNLIFIDVSFINNFPKNLINKTKILLEENNYLKFKIIL